MKYTIHGLQQAKLIELGLNNDDALVLSVIKDMYASSKIESLIIDNEKYIWVNQKSIVNNQIPILGSRDKFIRQLSKLEEKGLLKRKKVFSKNGVRGNYSYITITPKLDWIGEYDLVAESDTPCSKMQQPLLQNKTTLVAECNNKDYSIKDSSIIDSIYIHFNSKKIVISRSKTEKIIKAIKNALKNYSEDEIIKAVDNYNTVIKDNEYYFDTKWGLETFLKQSNGLAHFVDDGEKWINYKAYKKKGEKKTNGSFDYSKIQFD